MPMNPVKGPAAAGAQAGKEGRPGPYAWYVAVVLMLTYVIAMVDRKFPFILVESMRKDLSLSDTQIGLLAGVMFTVVYGVAAIPIARLSDRYSRKAILVVSLLFWSGMTSLGGFAQNFFQLAASRSGVAVGESSCSPASHSLIGDYFAPKHRAGALGLYFMGAYTGALIGLAAAGWINDLANWRVAMLVLGIPGALLALLIVFTVREPPRRSDPGGDGGDMPSVGATLKAIFTQPALVLMLLGGMTFTIAFGGAQAFGPAYLMRTFHMSSTTVGWSYGLCIGLSGSLGAALGGFVGDRLSSQRWKGLAFVALALTLGIPAFAVAITTNSYPVFWTCFFLAHIGMMAYAGPSFSYMQQRLHPRMHAVGSAIFLGFVSGLGQSIGPLVVGVLSDHFKAQGLPNPLKSALLILVLPSVIAALFYWAAALLARRDLRRAAPSA